MRLAGRPGALPSITMTTPKFLLVSVSLVCVALLIAACDSPSIDVSKGPNARKAPLTHPKVPTAPPTAGTKDPGAQDKAGG